MVLRNGSGLREYAVVPLAEYRRMKASNGEQLNAVESEQDKQQQMPANEQEEDDNESFEVETCDIPVPLQMVILYCPARTRKSALLLLQYIAVLNGNITYDPSSGEIAINTYVVRHSNLSEIFRILFTNRPGNVDEHMVREAIGLKEFLFVLSSTAMPSNLIVDKYWSNYFTKCRKEH